VKGGSEEFFPFVENQLPGVLLLGEFFLKDLKSHHCEKDFFREAINHFVGLDRSEALKILLLQIQVELVVPRTFSILRKGYAFVVELEKTQVCNVFSQIECADFLLILAFGQLLSLVEKSELI